MKESMSQATPRNRYFDFLRGIAIIMVVGIHTYPHNHDLHGPISHIIQLIAINVFCCAVPLFLTISGFFISQKNLNTFNECRHFWSNQIPTVYIPCLIFSTPWLFINLLQTNFSNPWNSILLFLTCGYSIYYFIALIIECYLLTPILIRYNNKRTLIAVLIISLSLTLVFEYFRFAQGKDVPLNVYCAAPMLLIFFYLGVYLSKQSRNYSLWIPILLMIIGLLLGLVHMQYIRETYGISAQGQKSSLYIFDIGFILLCMHRKCENMYRTNILTRILLYLGEISFGLYFTHIYVIGIVNKFLPSMRSYWILLWLSSLTATVIIVTVVKHINPNLSRKFLGYR